MHRPAPTDYASFYHHYVLLTRGANHLQLLEDSGEQFVSTLQQLKEEQGNTSYAEGKWTIKELAQHVLDTDVVFLYRALRFSRLDAVPLPGFEQDDFVKNCNVGTRTLASILTDFKHLRNYGIGFFKHLNDEQLDFKGSMSGNPATARALAFIMSGHCYHHLSILKERYL